MPPGAAIAAESGVTAVTDGNGAYEMTLPHAGPYDVFFRRKGLFLFGQRRRSELRQGLNTLNWSLTGGAVTITVSGWDERSPVSLMFQRTQLTMPGITSHGLIIQSMDELPVQIEGLELGAYEVQARQASGTPGAAGKTSERAMVVLSKEEPEAFVTLELKEYDSTLLVQDPSGTRLEHSRVIGPEGDLPRIGPGAFSLRNVSPGAFLTVKAAGFVPLCTRAPTAAETTLTLGAGQPVHLVFMVGPRKVTRPAGRFIWHGLDCPVPADQFDYAPEPSTAGEVRFLLNNFPVTADVRYLLMPFDPPDRAQPLRWGPNNTIEIRVEP